MGRESHWQDVRKTVTLSQTFFLLRNEHTLLGVMWYLLDPIFLFIVLFFLFSVREGSTVPLYASYLGLGLVLYNFFSTVLAESSSLLRSYRHLLLGMQLSVPVIVAALVLRTLYAHCIEIVALSLLLLYEGVSLISLFGYLPILLLFSVFLFCLAFCVSLLGVYVGDLEYIIRFGLLIIFLGTPIFYRSFLSLPVLSLNPLALFVSTTRDVIGIFPSTSFHSELLAIFAWCASMSVLAVLLHRTIGQRINEYV